MRSDIGSACVSPFGGGDPLDDPSEQSSPGAEVVGGRPGRQPRRGVDAAVRERPNPVRTDKGGGGFEGALAGAVHITSLHN
ncbi:hypothetical protein NCCP602_00520 [Brevibacterium metallidurans]|uniref:Uncharacterized protein n=1 Tax=Brevibacterium metallidurans TaxID=1482676 RepID=A0ABN0SID3_9MICO